MYTNFNLPDIDGKQTKRQVEQKLSEFRMYLLQLSLDKLPSVTAKYSLTPPTGGFNGSSTESAAIDNVDYERKRSDEMERMIRAINRLPFKERSLIVQRYCGEEELFDYEVYEQMNLSHRQYYRTKQNAFYRLAFALRIVAYKEVVGA